MAKRTRFEDYQNRYARYFRLEKTDDGILLVQMHCDGASFMWDYKAHDRMADLWADVSGDRELTAVILTGTGARYFLLTGQKLSAREAFDYGAVNEVLPAADLLPRARELAAYLALRPPLALRLTRSILVQELRRAAVNDLTSGVYQELYGMR